MKNQIFKHIQHSIPTKKYKSKNNQQLYKKQTDECFSSSEDEFMGSKYHAIQNPSSEKTAKNSKFISHQPSTHIDKESLRELSNMLQNVIKNRNMEVNSKTTKNETKRKATRNDQKSKHVANNTDLHNKTNKNKVNESKNVKKQKKSQKNDSKKKQNAVKKQELHNTIEQRNDRNHQPHKKQERRDNKKSSELKKYNQQFRKQGKLVIDLGKKNKNKQENNRTTVRAQLTTKAKLSQLRQMPSFREYCVIKGKFIPLQSTTQRKQLQSIFAETLCTTNACSNYNYLNQLSQRGQQLTQRVHMPKQNSQQNVQRNEVEIKTIKAQLAHYAVLVKAAQQDIGVQYSDRLNTNSSRKNIEVLKELKEQSKKQLQIQLHESNANSPQKSDRSILLEAMMKLESLEFDQNSVLQKLNLEQKRHFRQIFSSMLSKMKSPRIETPPNISRNIQAINEIQFLKGDKISKNKMVIVQQERRDELEQLLMMRQSRQNNQFNIVIRSPQHVDTSMLAVLACFTDIFCYVQMNCQQSLLQTMNGLYGLSYNDKYRCISRYYSQKQRKGLIYSEIQSQNLSIGIRIKMEIMKRQLTMRALPDSLFNNFMRQIAQDLNEQQANKEDNDISKKFQDKSYFWMHSKAIFDSINEMLMPYRPFYPTKGDPFPWSMSPLKCLTFYSIDSESLDTVIEQAQQKLTSYLKCLCGIHIDSSIYRAEDYKQKQQSGMDDKKDIVYSMRRDKLTKSIIQDIQLDNNDDPYLQLQIENTCILQQIYIGLTNNLLDEVLKQFSLFLL